MSETKSFIMKQLKEHGICANFEDKIEELTRSKVLAATLSPQAAYKMFLLAMSDEEPVFSAILKRTPLYDLSFTVKMSDINKELDISCDDAAEKLKEKYKEWLGNKLEYSYIEQRDELIFIGLKFKSSIYDKISNCAVSTASLPYYLASKSLAPIECISFNEPIYPIPKEELLLDIEKAAAQLIVDLRAARLPLSIVDYDLLYPNTSILPFCKINLHLEASSSWPCDKEARECAKTAFYCQMYSQCIHRLHIDKKYVVFKIDGIYFEAKIVLKNTSIKATKNSKIMPAGDMNARYHVELGLQERVKDLGEHFHRRVRMLKSILGDMGIYPQVFSDIFVDAVSLIYNSGATTDGAFIKAFLSAKKDLTAIRLDLNTGKTFHEESGNNKMVLSHGEHRYFLDVPIYELGHILEKLQGNIFTSEIKLISDKLLREMLVFDEYSFILSKNEISEGISKLEKHEIVGAYESEFLLGSPRFEDSILSGVPGVEKFIYSPTQEFVAVKIKADFDNELVQNIIITETSFSYIYK
ncbi:hypothetical protein ENBRE01_1409 [Enteropsectra breve]|nr:hypothetical protein ENBRE01_1032 [Enteropsectra breve]KAI5150292.1 hypothetical protein ENBRE01_1409 [Enteropsectra breve]